MPDTRLSDLVNQDETSISHPEAVLIGFPSDLGVSLNGGRPGARFAPLCIRKHLYRLTPHPDYHDIHSRLLSNCLDAGNIDVSDDQKLDHEQLAEQIAHYLALDAVPIILGGGHDVAYGHFLAYTRMNWSTEILNIDAHTDVRYASPAQPHSGSSFYLAQEHDSKLLSRYTVIGLQPQSVAREHLDYVVKNGGQAIFRHDCTSNTVTNLFAQNHADRIMATFCMDAVDVAQAPGVSAPTTNGLSTEEWLTYALTCGQYRSVTSLDIAEVNPELDIDDRTSRLAALTIWTFLLGLAIRQTQRG